MVNCDVPLPPAKLVGRQLQDTPLGKPEQVKLTVSVKPFCGAIVTVVVALTPAATLAGLSAPAVSVKDGIVVYHAWAST